MKKLILPTVLFLCPLLVLSGYARNNNPPVASNEGISVEELSTANSRARVISRLEKVGYSKVEAISRVDEMSDEEIAYFDQHPESIKRSGFIILASLIGSSIWSSAQAKEKKRVAEVQSKRDVIASIGRDIARKEKEQQSQMLLIQAEQDPAKVQERKAVIDKLGNEIKSLESNIQSLESEIKVLNETKAEKKAREKKAKEEQKAKEQKAQ